MGKKGETKDVEKKEVVKANAETAKTTKKEDKKTVSKTTSTKKTATKATSTKKPAAKTTTKTASTKKPAAKTTVKKATTKTTTAKKTEVKPEKKETTTKKVDVKKEEKKETSAKSANKTVEKKEAIAKKEDKKVDVKVDNKKETKKADAKVSKKAEDSKKENKEEKNNDVKTSICIFIGVILAIVLIFAIGVKLGQIKIDFPNKKGGNNDVKIEEQAENKEEVKNVDNRKIDYNKDFVYNSSYNNGKFEKMFKLDDNRVWRSSESLRYPIINLNSSYAKQVNDELKARFDKYYNAFGGALKEANIESKFIAEVSYKYAVKNDIVSVIVEEKIGSAGEEFKTSYYTYNVNMKTMQKASLEDVYKACDFKTENELNEKVKTVISDEISKGNLAEDTKWDGKVFYMDANGKFNIVINGNNKIQIK